MFSSERGHNAAPHAGRRIDQSGKGHSFRPVALPALAAAVQISASGKQAAQAAFVAKARTFVHEDDPQD